jgi:hypothetical protein
LENFRQKEKNYTSMFPTETAPSKGRREMNNIKNILFAVSENNGSTVPLNAA